VHFCFFRQKFRLTSVLRSRLGALNDVQMIIQRQFKFIGLALLFLSPCSNLSLWTHLYAYDFLICIFYMITYLNYGKKALFVNNVKLCFLILCFQIYEHGRHHSFSNILLHSIYIRFTVLFAFSSTFDFFQESLMAYILVVFVFSMSHYN